jgi:hypothetical protein
MSSREWQQGIIDGLEMSLDVCDKKDTLPDAREVIKYYLRLAKEDKFERLKEQLGALR